MSVEFYRESPGHFDSRTLNRKTLNRWTGRTKDERACKDIADVYFNVGNVARSLSDASEIRPISLLTLSLLRLLDS